MCVAQVASQGSHQGREQFVHERDVQEVRGDEGIHGNLATAWRCEGMSWRPFWLHGWTGNTQEDQIKRRLSEHNDPHAEPGEHAQVHEQDEAGHMSKDMPNWNGEDRRGTKHGMAWRTQAARPLGGGHEQDVDDLAKNCPASMTPVAAYGAVSGDKACRQHGQ